MNTVVRKRCPNWLPSEKKLLLDIVEKHYSVVESKKTDGVTMKQKHAKWKIMADEYNSQTINCSRTGENLKAQWESLKKMAKKEEASHRMFMIQTGGGPPKDKKHDPFHDRIICLIKTSAVGLFNPFDNDNIFQADETSQTTTSEQDIQMNNGTIMDMDPKDFNEEIKLFVSNDYAPQMNTPNSSSTSGTLATDSNNNMAVGSNNKEVNTKDWGDYTPELLKTPISKSLKEPKSWTSRRRPTHASTSQEMLHKKKIEAIELQKSLAVQEREQNKQIADLDIEIKKEQLKQEKLKTRLLLIELRMKKKDLKTT